MLYVINEIIFNDLVSKNSLCKNNCLQFKFDMQFYLLNEFFYECHWFVSY